MSNTQPSGILSDHTGYRHADMDVSVGRPNETSARTCRGIPVHSLSPIRVPLRVPCPLIDNLYKTIRCGS